MLGFIYIGRACLFVIDLWYFDVFALDVNCMMAMDLTSKIASNMNKPKATALTKLWY